MKAGRGILMRDTPIGLGHDYFPTDPEFVRRLLKVEKIIGDVWEPACGQGHISKVLEEAGLEVLSTDLINRGYGTGGIDFLSRSWPTDNIVTNPPFANNLSETFVKHALNLVTRKVVILQKLTWLASQRRKTFFTDTGFSRLYVFPDRMGSAKDGIVIKKDPKMIDFAWYVWDKSYKGPPTIHWLQK